jgi:hypothetical protein
MAAGQGYIEFATGDVLTAAAANGYLASQVVMVFASAAARTSAITSPQEGMLSYLKDTNAVEAYDGSTWISIGSTGDITGVTAGTGISGGGTSGTVTVTNSMATAIDAKGDLIAGTAADTFSRLAVGTNGQVLTADSAEATGMKWATAGGGGGGSLTLLETLTVGSTGVNSSTISGSYTNLLIIVRNVTSTGNLDMYMRFNSDTGSNYQVRGVFTDTTAAANNGGARDNLIGIASCGTSVTSDSIHTIYRYTDTSRRIIDQNMGGGISGPNYRYQNNLSLYSGSSAISSIQFTRVQTDHTFSSGTIYIYGVN